MEKNNPRGEHTMEPEENFSICTNIQASVSLCLSYLFIDFVYLFIYLPRYIFANATPMYSFS